MCVCVFMLFHLLYMATNDGRFIMDHLALISTPLPNEHWQRTANSPGNVSFCVFPMCANIKMFAGPVADCICVCMWKGGKSQTPIAIKCEQEWKRMNERSKLNIADPDAITMVRVPIILCVCVCVLLPLISSSL